MSTTYTNDAQRHYGRPHGSARVRSHRPLQHQISSHR
jgi:hypothetical protein